MYLDTFFYACIIIAGLPFQVILERITKDSLAMRLLEVLRATNSNLSKKL